MFYFLISIFLIFFIFYLYHLVKYCISQWFFNLPPGPLPLPIIGSLHLLSRNYDRNGRPLIHINLQDLIKKYGGIYGLYLGSYYTIVISDPILAHEIYVKNGSKTSDRCYKQSLGGNHVPSMSIATKNGKGIAMSHGSYWRRVRTALEKNISRKAPTMNIIPIIMIEINSIIDSLNNSVSPLNNLRTLLKEESMNIATQLLFSKRLSKDNPEDFQILQYSVEYLFENLSSGNPSDMIPLLRLFPNKQLDNLKSVVKRRDRIIKKLIDNERKVYKNTDRENCSNLCHLFLYDIDDNLMSNDEIEICIWDIIFAMTDTTATTNEWLIYYLINYPDVQKKIHQEIDKVIGNRLVTIEDKENMPYFNAVLKEVMRIKLVSPLMAPHYVSEEFSIMNGKYKLPLGTAIYMHGYHMAKHSDYWENPNQFNPDRWLNKEKDLDLYGLERRHKLEHYKFMPFSIGPRMCPGNNFAKVSLFLQSVSLIQAFEWSSNNTLNLTENWGLTIMPDKFGDNKQIIIKSRKQLTE